MTGNIGHTSENIGKGHFGRPPSGRYLPAGVTVLELHSQHYGWVAVINLDVLHDTNSVDNSQTFDTVVYLGETRATSMHSVTLTTHEDKTCSCLFIASGGATGVHEQSAFLRNEALFLAVGPYVVCVNIPDLSLRWSVQSDDATCFGVHFSDEHNCIISHGEITITRITLDGKTEWSAGGADIFTNPLYFDCDMIRTSDFNGREYTIRISDGRETQN